MPFLYVVLSMGLALLAAAVAGADDATPSLVERLGFPADARLVILNADDHGMNQATSQGTFEAMEAGGMTSATIMVPCPWFPYVVEWAKENTWANLGVHITLTSEWNRLKWGPVAGRSAVPSLVDDQGYFFPSVSEVYLAASLEHVETEVRAQIDKALAAGLDVTHIDSHMGTLQYAPPYHELYLQIADDYDLPCRVAGRELMEVYGVGHLIDRAAELGVLHPDFLFVGEPETLEDTERYWKEECLATLPEGKVSEVFIHCGKLTPEMEVTTSTWRRRTADTEFFKQPETLAYMDSIGITLISYRDLRTLQRTGEAPETISTRRHPRMRAK